MNPLPTYEDLDVSDDVNALLEGTEISKEFAEKAKTIWSMTHWYTSSK